MGAINEWNGDKTDKYGNNTDFPDEIVSDMTVKGILGKWCDYIYHYIKYPLWKYYMKTDNIDCGDTELIKALFRSSYRKVSSFGLVLEDMVSENISGLEDIFIAVYGVQSDEVYAVRGFLDLWERLYSKEHPWDEDYMWTDCRGDSRMKKLLESL